MQQFLCAAGWTIAAGAGIAIVLDLVRRLFRFLIARVKRARGAVPAPTRRATFWTGVLSLMVVVAIGLLGFFPANIAVQSLAVLMGFARDVKAAMLPGGKIILWAYLVAFIWIQLQYTMSLEGFWKRCRYLGLLVVIPVLAQVACWFAFDLALAHGLADADELLTAAPLAQLLSLGLLPFFVPALHHRVIAPVLTWASAIPGEKWRKTVVGIGNGLFALAMAGAIVLVGYACGKSGFARIEARPGSHAQPAAIGLPHSCVRDYPAESLRLGEEGKAIVAFRITTIGTVKDVTVVRSTGFERLDLATVECVTRWTYIPAVVDGQKVETPWKAQIVWKLK